ncbi:BQ2448_3852 [Microbotryum intermedium]|uniref:BQ2448_3852 protein n=1 Tax=Microbotryum intermedium TaxID=269621 RepID=A0A238FGJ9_9BASI|nr:BQ2448_3852 [Microbotryum intermedium]
MPTASSSSPSLFGGASTATSAAPSLFGSTAPSSSVAPSFSFDASSTPATSAAPSSLFGGGGAGAGGGLFGAPKPAGATTSLFGGPSTDGTGGGLFGTAAAAARVSTTTQGGGGLFGAPQQPGAAGTTAGLFGGAPLGGRQNKVGLFGCVVIVFLSWVGKEGPQQQQQQQGAFQPSALTQQQQQQQQASTSSLNKMTKFNDLPENVRAVIEGIDSFVRQQVHLSDQLKSRELGEEIEKTRNEWQQCSADATALSSLLLHSSNSVSALRNRLDQDAQDVEKATWIVEGFKNPQGPKAQQAKAVQTFPFEFFRNKTDEFEARLRNYKETIEQIQQHLTSPSSLSSSIDPSSIVPTLKSQTASFLALASNVASLQADLDRLKDQYRVIWRDKTGRVMDPFRERERGREVGDVVQELGRVEIR